MNMRTFLKTVWPASGPYCIATPWVRPDGETVMAHRGCETLDDVVSYVLTNKQSKDLYFAPHTLKVIRELNPKTGKFQTFRTHANMKEARSFFFDIDVGEHYVSQSEALGALEKFLFETCLPAPFVVSSGYGIHVYWVIDEPMESLAWKEPDARLFWLAQQHSLHVDPSRTTDQSSVLRVPNTFNYKDPGNPRRVEILAEGVVTAADKFLDQLNNFLIPEIPGNVRGEAVRRGDDSLSVAWDGRRPPADEVAEVCEHMKTFRDTKGNISEPLWHQGVGTIKHCDEGEAAIHEWSSGYPRYTQKETQGKIDRWTMPPPSCETISEKSGDPAVCARCIYKDLAKNPILIANAVYEKTHQPTPGPTATATSPEVPCLPPAPYTLDMVHGIKVKKDGVICEQPMFPVHWIKSTTNEDCLSHWYVKPLRGDWEKITILNHELELKTLAPALRNKNIFILPKQLKSMHTFMHAYIRELQRHQDTLTQYDYMGWEATKEEVTNIERPSELGDPNWFVLYGRKISVADGSIRPCVMTQNTQVKSMGRMGSLAQQIAIMEFYNSKEYMAQQFAIGASLATPFFKYSNHHGMLICLTGDTGSSKSTGLYFASSLWGHPELYPLSGLRSNATDKGRQERGAAYRNLPFMVDEITRLDDNTAHEIALSASQPGGYTSLTSTRKFRDDRGGYKSNLTICTSNKSLVQMVNADSSGGQAGIMRVFEIRVTRNSVRTKAEADAAMRLLVKNYGWIGEDFLRRCLPYTADIEKKFLEILQQFEAAINARPEERFTTAAAATALLGIKLGNKMGYFNFSYREMWDWLVNEQIPAMRAAAEQEREHTMPEAILNEYLEEINPQICRIDRNARGEIEILHSPPLIETKARYQIPAGEIYVRIGPFRDYCNKRRHDYSNILDQLHRGGIIVNKSTKKRMRSDHKYVSNPIACFVIQVKTTGPVAVPAAPPKEETEARKIVDFKKKD